MEWVESDSVDFINFAYVLHEMPEENAKTMVREMFRVLKPGGVINGFEVPYQRNPIAREFYVSMNTWNEDWQVQVLQFSIYFDYFEVRIRIFKIFR